MFSSLYKSRISRSLLCPVIGGKNGQAEGYQSNTSNYSSYRSLVNWLVGWLIIVFVSYLFVPLASYTTGKRTIRRNHRAEKKE